MTTGRINQVANFKTDHH